jgi:hypothetical protein
LLDSEDLCLLALGIQTRELGSEHPDTLASTSSLAATYVKQEWWSEAEELQAKVLEVRKRELGLGHPDTLTITHDLAETYRRQGRWSEAQRLLPHIEEDDDTASVASYGSLQSVFSTGSIASSVSSVSEPFISGMETFVEISTQRTDLVSLLGLATATVPRDKFLRNNARLLRILAKRTLGSESSQGARLAGRVLRDKGKRIEISRRLFTYYSPKETFWQAGRLHEHNGPEKFEREIALAESTRDDSVYPPPTSQLQAEQDSDSSGESSASSEDEDADHHNDPYGLTDFVLHSDVFSGYVHDLWLFLNPATPQLLIETAGRGDLQRVRELVDHALTSRTKARPDWFEGLADLDLGPEQNAQLFTQTLLRKLQGPYAKRIAGALTTVRPREGTAALIRDLAWVPPKRVQIYTKEDLAVSDLVKERIEGMNGTTWDWWPLASPKKRIAAGYSRVKWNTVSTLISSRISKANSPAPGEMGEPLPDETGEQNGPSDAKELHFLGSFSFIHFTWCWWICLIDA